LNDVIKACGQEVGKIGSLLNEVNESETILIEENTGFLSEIQRLQAHLKSTSDQIDTGVAIQMEEIFKQISELNGVKANLNRRFFKGKDPIVRESETYYNLLNW